MIDEYEDRLFVETELKDAALKAELNSKMTIAKNLLAMDLDVEAIVMATGLSASEIEKLGVTLLNDEEK